MGKVVFIGDDHGRDGSIKSNYKRFKSINGKIGNKYVLLLEIDYDGTPEEKSSIANTINLITRDKTGGSFDKEFLMKMANNASFCFGFDSEGADTSTARHKKQYSYILKFAKEYTEKNMDVVVVIGAGHLEPAPLNTGFLWNPHHEMLDKALQPNQVYCYSIDINGKEISWDDT
jgi:hypothetical protein